MATSSSAKQIYSDVVNCSLKCAGIERDPGRGLIPRSFYWREATSDYSLLVVSKNPSGIGEYEQGLYKRTKSQDLVDAHLSFVDDLFEGRRSINGNYHSTLIKRVAAVLGVGPTPSEVFRHAAMTSLAKCQSSGNKSAPLPTQTYLTCAQRFLLREIEHFKPAYLLALGNEAFRVLTSEPMFRLHRIPVGELYHPSWSNMKGGEVAYLRDVIPRLRGEYKSALLAREAANMRGGA